MSLISNNAFIHKNAVIGKNVKIAPNVVIDENVKIDDNCEIYPNVHITGWTDIGENNKILNGAVLGGEPQDFHYKGERSYVQIGNNNIIHEYVTIHRGTEPESKTIIGNNNMFMAYSHCGHNVIVHNNVIIVNNTALGGYVEVFDNAFISSMVPVHQFCKIGKLAMIGMSSSINKDVPPFMIVRGADGAKVYSMNVVGMRRYGISQDDRNKIKQAYMLLYREGLNIKQAIEAIVADEELNENKYIIELITFIRNSGRGICDHVKK